jgi:hypothetical protein
MGRGDASVACTPVGRRYHRLLSDLDGPVDEASVSVPLAHKRALLCGERPSKAAPGPETDWLACTPLGAPGMVVSRPERFRKDRFWHLSDLPMDSENVCFVG